MELGSGVGNIYYEVEEQMTDNLKGIRSNRNVILTRILILLK